MIEPGRHLVGDAGLLRSEILLISYKSPSERERWVYLDADNGLDETLQERIHYRIRTPRDGGLCRSVILAGPTCDSEDILYCRHPYELSLDLEIGEPVDFLSAGAYTASVAAVAFNGFSADQQLLHLRGCAAPNSLLRAVSIVSAYSVSGGIASR